MFEEQYVLDVNTPKGPERVYLDVSTVDDVNRVHDADVELPWRLAFDHRKPARIGGVDFYVPKPEILLLLKAKAALDREHDAKRSFDPFHLQQKSWKDYYDMASLLKTCTFDVGLMTRIAAENRFSSHFERAIASLARKRSVLDRHGVRWADLRAKLKTVK